MMMRKLIFAALFLAAVSSAVLAAEYDEILARYKLWPMASAAFSSNPGLCIKDNFKDAEVCKILLILNSLII